MFYQRLNSFILFKITTKFLSLCPKLDLSENSQLWSEGFLMVHSHVKFQCLSQCKDAVIWVSGTARRGERLNQPDSAWGT